MYKVGVCGILGVILEFVYYGYRNKSCVCVDYRCFQDVEKERFYGRDLNWVLKDGLYWKRQCIFEMGFEI